MSTSQQRDQFKDTRQRKRQQGSAWLKEGDEDEPLNFLDPTAAKRVLSECLLLHWLSLSLVGMSYSN